MKSSILKMIFGLALGIVLGLVIAAIGVVCFTDTTFSEYLENLNTIELGESALAAGVGIIAFIASVIILIVAHEAGHLVCGLLSGYKFVSFRIFDITIIKTGGRLRIKKYAVAGTGGQCLLTPPGLPLERIPAFWYNFGGVFFNFLMVLAAVPLMFIDLYPLLSESVFIFILTGVFLIITNGVPMRMSGAGNDGYNILLLRKNLLSKRGLVDALRANALIQDGVRPKDMPDSWFEYPDVPIDYSDQLQVSIPMMIASRFLDEFRFQDALNGFENLYCHKKYIIGLYLKEIECELVFLRLVFGYSEEAKTLLTPELEKYITAFRKTMSSKERVLFAISLFIDNDREKAMEIYRDLQKRADGYLMQGEVRSDLAIMGRLLEQTAG